MPDVLLMSFSFLSEAGACEPCRQLTRARCGTKVSQERRSFCIASVLIRTQRSCTLGVGLTFLSPLPGVSPVGPHPRFPVSTRAPCPLHHCLCYSCHQLDWFLWLKSKRGVRGHDTASFTVGSNFLIVLGTRGKCCSPPIAGSTHLLPPQHQSSLGLASCLSSSGTGCGWVFVLLSPSQREDRPFGKTCSMVEHVCGGGKAQYSRCGPSAK